MLGNVAYKLIIRIFSWNAFAQSCPTLCSPMDHQAPLSMEFGARILEQVAISYSRGSFWPRNLSCISCIAGGLFTIDKSVKPHLVENERLTVRIMKKHRLIKALCS